MFAVQRYTDGKVLPAAELENDLHDHEQQIADEVGCQAQHMAYYTRLFLLLGVSVGMCLSSIFSLLRLRVSCICYTLRYLTT